MADGTYTGANTISGVLVGNGGLTIQGNPGTPGNVIISTTNASCFVVSNYANVTIKDMELRTTTFGLGIYASTNATVYFQNIRFGANAYQHMQALGATIQATGNYAITGGAQQHWAAAAGGLIQVQSVTVTLSGTPAFSGQFAQCTVVAAILCIMF